MSIPVTVDQVKEIFPTSLTDAEITAFITMADALVTTKLVPQQANFSCLTDDVICEIEKLLAAHLASMSDQRVQSEKTGDASYTYQGKTDMGLKSTLYGQNAIILDCSNTLVNLGKEGIRFTVLNDPNCP